MQRRLAERIALLSGVIIVALSLLFAYLRVYG